MSPNTQERLLAGAAAEIRSNMQTWFDDVNKTRKKCHLGRTLAEQHFDFGVMAAAEFVRRFTKDERLALLIHEACLTRCAAALESNHSEMIYEGILSDGQLLGLTRRPIRANVTGGMTARARRRP